MFVTVFVGLLAEPEVPLPPPPDEPLLDGPDAGAARLPITLKVTVNGSLVELVNFSSRDPEVSFADKML
jgi:hypothetical protein